MGKALKARSTVETPEIPYERDTLLALYRNMVISRLLDDEEIRLKKRNLVYFQVSSAGHEALGVAVAHHLDPKRDWFYPYYRDRALCLGLGMTPLDMMLSAAGSKDDPISAARQMPCHWSSPELHIVSQSSPTGSQYNQAVGCAEAGRYIRRQKINLPAADDEITLVTSGEGASSQGELWEALNVASNLKLPVLFLIEDNEYAISVPVEVTTSGGNIAHCFSGMPDLLALSCNGSDLVEALETVRTAAEHLRAGKGPVLLHAKVTRPYSHSLSDDQVYYRTKEELQLEKESDCMVVTERFLLENGYLDEVSLVRLKEECRREVRAASDEALNAPKPSPSSVFDNLYSSGDVAIESPGFDGSPRHGGEPLTIAEAINRTLAHELATNEKVLIFGEDVADASREEALSECKGKGGVFKVTYGLQREFGSDRVYNTLLAEASIMGRAIGMACRGLKPVPEIQFLDFIWPAFNQIRSELATMRFRSGGGYSAPVVVRVPSGGYLRGGAIYHSQSAESIFAACSGLLVACPSNASDAMGLLRTALRMDDPVIFLEHKHLYLQTYSRANDPGPEHMIPFGRAKIKRAGNDITVIAWGALVQKSLEAAQRIQRRTEMEVEVLDLRTIVPLDRESIFASVRKTGRVLVAYEEPLTGGFGAEIAALIADECFEWLDAPVKRVGAKHAWVAYSPVLEEATLPQTEDIERALEELAAY